MKRRPDLSGRRYCLSANCGIAYKSHTYYPDIQTKRIKRGEFQIEFPPYFWCQLPIRDANT
jgi:hypothetical protein